MKTETNPWLVESAQRFQPGAMTCDAHDRMERIRTSLDPDWLRLVLAYRDNQLSVRRAAEKRLRRLQKLRKGNGPQNTQITQKGAV